MRKPLAGALAALLPLLTVNLSAFAEAPKEVGGTAVQQLSGAGTAPNANYDNNRQTGSTTSTAQGVLANNAAKQSGAAPETPAAAKRPLAGEPAWSKDAKNQVEAEPKGGAFSEFMNSGAPWILGGGAAGAIIGAMVGGPFGFLLGGMLGIIGGYALHTFIMPMFKGK